MGAGAGDDHFQRAVAAVRPRWGIDHAPIRPRRKILPLSQIERTYGDRLIVVGDAAGLVKPTTGGGIYYSLLSARLAAQTLTPALRADDLRAEALAHYQRAWRQRLGSELRWQTVLRRLAQELSDDDINRLFELSRAEGLVTLARRTASFNRHGEFIMALLRHPPARRLLFKNAFA
jgi:flavin-dependent dehydrogenase